MSMFIRNIAIDEGHGGGCPRRCQDFYWICCSSYGE